jgi:SanA protein
VLRSPSLRCPAMPDADLREPHRRRARRWALLSTATGAGFLLARKVQVEGAHRIVPLDSITSGCALVLGALVKHGVTPVLADRVATAVDLYRAGRVTRLRLSGSTAAATGNEVAAMQELVRAAGVPEADVELDPCGRHTYESMLEARAAGPRHWVVVTQRFHLPRALYLAERAGLEAVGVEADRRLYQGLRDYRAREAFSSVLAYWLSRG